MIHAVIVILECIRTAGSKLIYIRYVKRMSFDEVHPNAVNRWIMVLPLGKGISFPQRISFFISSCTLGEVSNRSTPETYQQFSSQRKMNSIGTILRDG